LNALILSCNVGEGHNAVARALAEQLQQQNCSAQVLDALHLARPALSRAVAYYHNCAYRYFPRLYGNSYEGITRENTLAYQSVQRLLAHPPAMFTQRLQNLILQNRYDAILCTHVIPALLLTILQRKNSLPHPCCTAFVATDYSCVPLLNETELDAYFIPQRDLVEEFIDQGLPREKLYPLGIPVCDRYGQKQEQDAARRELGLLGYAHVVLLMSGSMGAGPVEALVRDLYYCLGEDTAIVVLCGRNEKLRRTLTAYYPAHRVIPVPFTHRVNTYMDAADLLITKAGGITCSEAGQKGIPLLLVDGVSGCETQNVAFFRSHGMAYTFQRQQTHAAAQAAQALLADLSLCRYLVQQQLSTIPREPAKAICRMLTQRCTPRSDISETERSAWI